LSIHYSNGFSNVPRTATAPVDAILEPAGGFSHVVDAGENRQPSCMHIGEDNTSSHAQSFTADATREHRMDTMSYIEGMTDERACLGGRAIGLRKSCHSEVVREPPHAGKTRVVRALPLHAAR
jgi:hypothetical protein